jgi:hypothetical protein
MWRRDRTRQRWLLLKRRTFVLIGAAFGLALPSIFSTATTQRLSNAELVCVEGTLDDRAVVVDPGRLERGVGSDGRVGEPPQCGIGPSSHWEVERMWSVPEILGNPRMDRRIARFSQIIPAAEGRTYVVGNNVLAQPLNDPISAPLMTLWDSDGNAIGPPPAPHWFGYPRGVSMNGRLTMVWAEPEDILDPTELMTWLNVRFNALWYADYTVDRGWMAPQLIYRGPVLWNKASTDQFLLTDRGEVHFAAASFALFHPEIVHGRFDGSTWTVQPIETGTGVVTHTSLTRQGDHMIMAFISGFAEDGMRDFNSAFVMESADAGRTWSSPFRLTPVGGGAHNLKARVDTNGRLLVVWLQDGGAGQRQIRLRYRNELTGPWSEPVDHSFSGDAVVDLAAGVDGCGGLHVLLTLLSADNTARIMHAAYRSGWEEEVEVFPGFGASDPALALDVDGRLQAVAIGTSQLGSAGEQIVNVRSRFRPC